MLTCSHSARRTAGTTLGYQTNTGAGGPLDPSLQPRLSDGCADAIVHSWQALPQQFQHWLKAFRKKALQFQLLGFPPGESQRPYQPCHLVHCYRG